MIIKGIAYLGGHEINYIKIMGRAIIGHDDKRDNQGSEEKYTADFILTMDEPPLLDRTDLHWADAQLRRCDKKTGIG